jgi:RHS repeat-associated protein
VQAGERSEFTYDVRDQLVAVRRGAATLGLFGYDYQGLPVTKLADGQLLRYVYDDQSVLLQTDPAGATVAKYDYGPDRLLSLTHATQGRQFYLFDALGSVTDLIAQDGSLRATYQYDAWGNSRDTTGGSFNIFGFTGHERDDETGLYYFKARFYDPELGIFLSEDPAAGDADNPPSLHRYLYAYANPTVYVDPDGRRAATEEDKAFMAKLVRLERALRQEYKKSGTWKGKPLSEERGAPACSKAWAQGG